uniref:type II toxin-antitoxin system RelE/ParE family toxin n=1 Tax=Enterocloster aldenensis TaxID=358742 RepID=UPI001F2A7245
MEHAIELLAEQPYHGVKAKHTALRRMGFRMVIIENHLIFYKVRERDYMVIIYAIVDARRDYANIVI